MRFEEFLANVERDIAFSKGIKLEKTKDITGRPLIFIRKNNKKLAQIAYAPNSYGKTTRVLKLFFDGGTTTTFGMSGNELAKHLYAHLAQYTSLKNSGLLMLRT